ncbi:MAG: PepSY domain-containing protein [Oscillospiraceae bacterium]|nr:PepSY domain-containing protein [Oscillospiraceae bacterium]
MSADELKKRLTEELSDMAPNRLDDLLRACEESNRAPRPAEAPRPRRSMPRLLAAAAVFVLLLGGILGYRAMDASRCIVTVDVNPSVSLTVNRFNRVKEVTPGNEDAQVLLDGVDLTGMRLRGALEKLTALLMENDYLSGTENAMLVSVENATAGRSEALCKRVVASVGETTKEKLFQPAVLCQQISGKNDLQSVAETLHVSVGKAALAEALAAQIEGSSAERLSTLSIRELLYLADSESVTLQNTSVFGTVNRVGYCDRADAIRIALANAGLSGTDAPEATATPDGRDGDLVYIVCFGDETQSYRYTISAKGGAVLDAVQTGEGEQTDPEQSGASSPSAQQPESTQGLIGPEAENTNVELLWIGGRPVYRVTFELDGQKHSFYVDARTDDLF